MYSLTVEDEERVKDADGSAQLASNDVIVIKLCERLRFLLPHVGGHSALRKEYLTAETLRADPTQSQELRTKSASRDLAQPASNHAGLAPTIHADDCRSPLLRTKATRVSHPPWHQQGMSGIMSPRDRHDYVILHAVYSPDLRRRRQDWPIIHVELTATSASAEQIKILRPPL